MWYVSVRARVSVSREGQDEGWVSSSKTLALTLTLHRC